jgi:molybdopterin biosynthesis enzyme MoaB
MTVSDGVAQGTREDASGAVAAELLRAAGFDVETREVVPDEGPGGASGRPGVARSVGLR